MLKRILSAVGVMALGFIVVAAVVLFRFHQIGTTIGEQSDVSLPFYQAAIDLDQETHELQRVVAATFLATSATEITALETDLVRTARALEQTVTLLGTHRFSTLHGLPVVDPAATNQTLSVRELLAQLGTNVVLVNDSALRSVGLARRQLELRRQLDTERETLSKVFRRSGTLQAVDEKAWGVLSRSVLCALHSTSTSDLNFVGRARFQESSGALQKAGLQDEQKKLFAALKEQFDKTIDLALAASATSADYEFFRLNAESVHYAVDPLRATAEAQLAAGQKGLVARAGTTSRFVGVFVAVILTVGVALSVFIARRLTRQVAGVVSGLRTSAHQLGEAAGLVQEASAHLADGASAQAASLEETSASIEEMRSTTEGAAGNAQQAALFATHARNSVESGLKDLQQMGEAMEAIKTSGDRIAAIVKSIDEIAFQTNILALNAAVEAARAGEAGAGFSVVAEEVRNLAQRSAKAARETAERIETSVHTGAEGVRISAQVMARLQDVGEQIRQADQLIGQIAVANREHSSGINEISKAVTQIDQITQRNAASAEENAATIRQINGQSETLKDAIRSLESLVGSRVETTCSRASRHDEEEPEPFTAPRRSGRPAEAASAP